MPGSISATPYIDRENNIFELYVDFQVDAYVDPETGEYFEDIAWYGSLTQQSGGATTSIAGGYGSGSGYEIVSLGLTTDGAPHRYRVDFTAYNTFSGEDVSVSWEFLDCASLAFGVIMQGTTGTDFLIGGQGHDHISGLTGNDWIDGGAGGDTMLGGEGADQLDGGGGKDLMIGGAGNDIYMVAQGGDIVVEQAGEGLDLVVARISHGLGDNVENLRLETYAGSISGTGNALANRIDGNGYANRIDGGEGDDDLRGYSGQDTLSGGGGRDRLDGGAFSDLLRGGAGNDTYVIDGPGDTIEELPGDGVDTVELSHVAVYELSENVEDLVRLGNQAVTVTGNAANNHMAATIAADRLSGLTGDDWLVGREGNDILAGGLGADILDGGAGRDVASYATMTTRVNVNLTTGFTGNGEPSGDTLIGIEDLIAGSGDDYLVGDAGANALAGGAGADALFGVEGNDVLEGGAGADRLNGGSGLDIASYAGSTGAIAIDLATGAMTGMDTLGDVLISIEGLTGGDVDDVLGGNAADNILSGLGGADILTGLDGDDVISGGAGGDTLSGGAGIDRLSYVGAIDAVTVDLGAGTASGGDAAADSFQGFENVIGGHGADRLSGDAGDNGLNGGSGNDVLDGGAGDDTLIGGRGSNRLSGGEGNDTVSYVSTVVSGVSASLSSYGNAHATSEYDHYDSVENLIGTRFNDGLSGDAAANRLSGGDGNDYLSGNGGDDVLTGGAGIDSFAFEALSGRDIIRDFAGAAGERLYLYLDESFDSYGEWLGAARASGANGGNTTFDLASGNSITLIGVSVASLQQEWFVFWPE